jgi:hypothetical protein
MVLRQSLDLRIAKLVNPLDDTVARWRIALQRSGTFALQRRLSTEQNTKSKE